MEHLLRHTYRLSALSLLICIVVSCTGPDDYSIEYTWSSVQIDSDNETVAALEKIIVPYREQLDSTMNEVIGYAAHDLTTEDPYESTLGTFVTKLLYEQSITFFNQKVDLSMMNHQGGLRAPINAGPITLREVFEVMPFENQMLLLEIPGDSLTKVIEDIGASGGNMIWPVSYEVFDGKLKDIRVDGEAIIGEKTYILTISDYLANGGSGFHILKPFKRLDVKQIKLRDMIEREIRQQTAKGDSIKVEIANYITVSNS